MKARAGTRLLQTKLKTECITMCGILILHRYSRKYTRILEPEQAQTHNMYCAYEGHGKKASTVPFSKLGVYKHQNITNVFI